MTLPLTIPEDREAGHRVVFVLRPERFHVSRGGHEHGLDALLPTLSKNCCLLILLLTKPRVGVEYLMVFSPA